MITTRDKLVDSIVTEMENRRNLKKMREEAIRENWRMLREKGFDYIKGGMPPALLDYENGRYLYDVMSDGQWKGQRCFIIGGGESLKGFDFSKLKNELVIGVNRAYEVINCTINFAMDKDLYDLITKGKLGEKAKEKFENYKGFPVWLDTVGYNYPRGVFILNKTGGQALSSSMKDGIGGASNSGFGALGLAVCLGANPIYLLGFDMKGKDGKQCWWHDGYPNKKSEVVYKVFINDFKRVAPGLEKDDIQVINLNRESELQCFEFGNLDDIKPIKRPIIVSYYTEGTGYETQVEQLKATLRRFNLENDVVKIPDQGSWRKNVYYKAGFILEMMNKYPNKAIVFIDADAKIRMNPVLFNDFDYDFACHFYNRKELLSGTLYFGNTKGAKFLINEWIKENESYPTVHMPQRNLQAVFNKQKDNIKWKALPVEYCMIFDSRARQKVCPVIEHFQLSRIYKDYGNLEVKKRGYGMTESLAEIQEFCKGKKICLFGNADSVLREKKDIDDSFDVTCRMNRGKPQGKEEFIGSRTDILFLSTHMCGENIHNSYDPRFAVWMTVCHRLASTWTMNNAIQNPAEDWNALYKELSINPTTGIMALNFILKHIDFKSLIIYGFDFFETKTWYNTEVDSGKKHSGKKEKLLFMKMIKDNPKVKFIK